MLKLPRFEIASLTRRPRPAGTQPGAGSRRVSGSAGPEPAWRMTGQRRQQLPRQRQLLPFLALLLLAVAGAAVRTEDASCRFVQHLDIGGNKSAAGGVVVAGPKSQEQCCSACVHHRNKTHPCKLAVWVAGKQECVLKWGAVCAKPTAGTVACLRSAVPPPSCSPGPPGPPGPPPPLPPPPPHPLPEPMGPAVWTAGAGLLRVSALPTVTEALLFRFDVNGSIWLSSADVMLRCGGIELSSSDSTLQAAASTIINATDLRLGAYDGVEQHWSPVAGAPAECSKVTAVASARYYSARDLFEFRLVLPEGSTGTRTDQVRQRHDLSFSHWYDNR
eukprot:COSAG06_NODE_1684_length_8722_cov_3.925896_4_plen_332_part_00